MRSRDFILLSFTIFLVFAYGLYDSPLSTVNRESDFEVEAEYINGILTASGILFGLWFVVIERKPKDGFKRWQYEHNISESFFFCFAFLIISVLLVALTAVNLYSSVFALLFCTISFIINTCIITLTLYFYKFKEAVIKIPD